MNRDELRELVNRAAFLHERLGDDWQPYTDPFSQDLAQRRLARWCQTAANGDWDRFAQRLAWDGLDLAGARSVVAPGRLTGDGSLPDWANFLAEGLAEEGDLLLRLGQAAQKRLAEETDAALNWFSSQAMESVKGYLTRRLTELAGPTLAQSPADDAAALVSAYPVLARQAATVCLNWVAETAGFLQRLAQDWPELPPLCPSQIGPEAGWIANLRPGLSDPHNGGRTVWQISLADGASIAYKPKDLGLDQAWNRLIDWCNQAGMEPALGPLWVLGKEGYGWMEWADHQPETATDLAYFERLGGLLALLELVHAADAHRENLLCRGGQPLLIDGEMLGYPQMARLESADTLDAMRTGVLPRWAQQGGTPVQIAGLPGEDALSGDQIEQMVAGYRQVCTFLNQHWPALNEADGPLASLRRGAVRMAPRPTAAYDRLLGHLRGPACLGDGMDFSMEADRLAASLLTNEAISPSVLAGEHRAISQRDVPVFHARMGEPWPGGELIWPDFAPKDAVGQAIGIGLIRASLETPSYLAEIPKTSTFLEIALSMAEMLLNRAVEREDGGLTWINRQFQPRSGLHQHGLIGGDLYAGWAGIGLFFAGIAHVTGSNRWREVALHTLSTRGEYSADPGGQIYALSLAGQWLKAPVALEQATKLATADWLDADALPWGMVDGQAGLVCGLLALHHVTKERAILGRAVAAGDRLLAGASQWQNAQWQNAESGLGGMAHGAAGIGLALVRLYRASGEERFLSGARGAWAFQQSLFDDPPGNWQDRRGAQPVYLGNWCHGAAGIGLAASFCLNEIEDAESIVERAVPPIVSNLPNLAGAETPPVPVGHTLDTLCCGHFGQIDALDEIASRMSLSGLTQSESWRTQSGDTARRLMFEAAQTGHFTLYDDLPESFNPTFFRGMAGIGYTYLRLGASGQVGRQLPCVLGMSMRWDEALKSRG